MRQSPIPCLLGVHKNWLVFLRKIFEEARSASRKNDLQTCRVTSFLDCEVQVSITSQELWLLCINISK